jgi:hypothetical protein
MTRDQIGEDGIEWVGGKRQAGQSVKRGLIEWSPALRAAVGNLSGQRYTKGGWKKTLSVLMTACVAEASRRELEFAPFSLQDCRPKGVSDKLERGDSDTVDATPHSNERMIRNVYDRRRIRVARPAG